MSPEDKNARLNNIGQEYLTVKKALRQWKINLIVILALGIICGISGGEGSEVAAGLSLFIAFLSLVIVLLLIYVKNLIEEFLDAHKKV